MWLPTKAFDLFRVAKDTVDSQREELATLKVERDRLKSELASSRANEDWMRLRINSLEVERAQLMAKAYGINVPVPEIVRTSPNKTPMELNGALFEDIGEDAARQLGLPTYNS